MWKKLGLILWKNLIIRKRHWLLTTVEILIPILLFTLVAYGRSKISGLNKSHVEEQYYDISSEESIYSHLSVGELKLWYSPPSYVTKSVIRKVQQKLQIRGDVVEEFATKTELLKNFQNNSDTLIAAIIFDIDGRHLKYDLTMYDKYFKWNTDKLFIPAFTPEDARSSKYLYKGYAALQLAIDMSYMELYTDKKKEVAFSLQEFPDPPRTIDSGLNQLFMYFLPLITIFSFIFLCPAVLQRVGEEKSSGTKEYMKMVGLKSWMIWLGWFIHALTTNLFSIIAIVILMKVPFWGVPYPPIEYLDGTVLFLFLFLYCMAAITFCFLIATVFNSPSIGTVMGVLIWIFSYFIPQTLVSSYENLPWLCKIPFAVLPNMALHYGYSAISVYEMRETGIQWYNLFKPGSGDANDVTMGNVFVMLICDMIIFMLATLYIENVMPGEYGIAKPYSFPLKNLKGLIKRCFQHRVDLSPEVQSLNDEDIEQGVTAPPCIQIRHLRKKYHNHVAVDNLNMDIYKNHITVLLGQNGAGKTTTMSILTGMIDATAGRILVNGKNIKKHTDDVRKIMGLCTQHNLLFPDLTVMEHLQFFAMLKGSSDVNLDAKEMLEKLGIDEKKYDMASVLSGGMKRKLCLGMALIGNSEILILDEPTSGVDPESRRKVWNLLQKYKETKTILITTHFMEEADVLGEFIAIMANGRLQCFGRPNVLKSKYNTGYHLSLLLTSDKKIATISSLVERYFGDAKLIRICEDSAIYLLPIEKEKIKYKDLVIALEERQNELDIVAINMNETTLNDVFLKAKDEVDAGMKNAEPEFPGIDVKFSPPPPVTRQLNNFIALFKKRWYFLKRKYYWFIPAPVVMICIFLLAIWLALSGTNYYDGGGPSLNLTLQMYGKPRIYYGGSKSSNSLVDTMRLLYKEAVLRENGDPVFEEDVSNGIIEEGINNIAFYKKHMIIAAEFNHSENRKIVVNSMYSPEALHSIPISINLAMNSIIKALLNDSFSITISNTPLKSFSSEFAPSELSAISVTSVWLILIPLSMFFFMSNFIIFPNTEVSTDFLKIQTIAGIKTILYWISNVAFDLIFSVLPLLALFFFLFLINFAAYNSTAFEGKEYCTIAAMLVVFILVTLPFTYLLSYRQTITGGFNMLLMFGIFAGIIPTLVVIAMEFSAEEFYKNLAERLKIAFLVTSPHFGLSYASVKFSKKYVENFNWKYMDPNKRNYICLTDPNPCCHGDSTAACSTYQDYFVNKDYGIQKDLLIMMSAFFIYFFILYFLNTENYTRLLHFVKYFPSYISSLAQKKSAKRRNSGEQDDNDRLRVTNLSKTFGRKQIVKNLKFALKKNQCFGLLGVNGAGKSTTFRMLTKYLFYDDGGEIKIVENDKTETDAAKPSHSQSDTSIKQSEYCEKIGYCPQEDCLNYFLTGEELLYTMACLKGYSTSEANNITRKLLICFGLYEYRDKPCLEYSGGNKRKLSSCLAFLGSPKVILLDEPTSGVDPASRRKFWDILMDFKKSKGASFLLCSHSMEECENLCDEIAIMKEGEIKDQGSLLALKNKYQRGFKATVKLAATSDEEASQITKEIESRLDARIIEKYGESLSFQVNDSNKRLSHLFVALEELKCKYNKIEDYMINQISLEDIFLRVAEDDEQI